MACWPAGLYICLTQSAMVNLNRKTHAVLLHSIIDVDVLAVGVGEYTLATVIN